MVLLTLALYLRISDRKRPYYAAPVHKQLTFDGDVWSPAISPDGNFLAYIRGKPEKGKELIVQDMSGGHPISLLSTQSILYYEWAPDGSALGVFLRRRGLLESVLVPRLGGEIRPLSPGSFSGWSPDGSKYLSATLSSKEIHIVDRTTGRRSKIELTGRFLWLNDVEWSPFGNFVLFKTQNRNGNSLWTIRDNGKDQKEILKDSLDIYSPRLFHSGDAVYYLRIAGPLNNLMKLPVDPATGAARGKPRKVQTGIPSLWPISISRDGHNLYYPRITFYSNIALVEQSQDGQKVRHLTKGTRRAFSFSPSPDGKKSHSAAGTQKRQTSLFST